MLLPFQILPDTLFYILCFQGETAFNSNLNTCMLKQSSFRTNQLEMGIPETPDCAQSEKYPFYSTLSQAIEGSFASRKHAGSLTVPPKPLPRPAFLSSLSLHQCFLNWNSRALPLE